MITYTEIINGQEVTIKQYSSNTRSSKKSAPIKVLFPPKEKLTFQQMLENQEQYNVQHKIP